MQSASRSCMIMNENTDVISITLQAHLATSRAGQRADRSIHSAAEFQLAERAIGRRCHRAPSGLRCHMAIRRLELPLSPYACHERTRIDHGSRGREGRRATRLALPCSAPSCRKSAESRKCAGARAASSYAVSREGHRWGRCARGVDPCWARGPARAGRGRMSRRASSCRPAPAVWCRSVLTDDLLVTTPLRSNRLSEPLCADGARLLNVRRVDHSVVRFQRRRHRGSSEKQPWPHSSLETLMFILTQFLIWILV